jgi:UDP-N-acetylmuramate dehydrogenase
MAIVIQEHVPLNEHTTLKTGGVARYMVEVRSLEDLREVVDLINKENLPYLVLGGGSNIFAGEAGFPGVVIKMMNLGLAYADKENGEVEVKVASGEWLDGVIETTIAYGIFGLENLSAIPGTVGATPVQNVGAYGVEVKDIISSVEAFHLPTKSVRVFSKEECEFGYRDSFFKTKVGSKYIIFAVNFLLHKKFTAKVSYADLAKRFSTELPTAQSVRDALIEIRGNKFPDWKVVGTAGSFFKNPIIPRVQGEALRAQYAELTLYDVSADTVKVPLGYILDKVCNLKGFRVGNVGLYPEQALVLVNYGGATPAQINAFVEEIKSRVFADTGIIIEPEVKYV